MAATHFPAQRILPTQEKTHLAQAINENKGMDDLIKAAHLDLAENSLVIPEYKQPDRRSEIEKKIKGKLQRALLRILLEKPAESKLIEGDNNKRIIHYLLKHYPLIELIHFATSLLSRTHFISKGHIGTLILNMILDQCAIDLSDTDLCQEILKAKTALESRFKETPTNRSIASLYLWYCAVLSEQYPVILMDVLANETSAAFSKHDIACVIETFGTALKKLNPHLQEKVMDISAKHSCYRFTHKHLKYRLAYNLSQYKKAVVYSAQQVYTKKYKQYSLPFKITYNHVRRNSEAVENVEATHIQAFAIKTIVNHPYAQLTTSEFNCLGYSSYEFTRHALAYIHLRKIDNSLQTEMKLDTFPRRGENTPLTYHSYLTNIINRMLFTIIRFTEEPIASHTRISAINLLKACQGENASLIGSTFGVTDISEIWCIKEAIKRLETLDDNASKELIKGIFYRPQDKYKINQAKKLLEPHIGAPPTSLCAMYMGDTHEIKEGEINFEELNHSLKKDEVNKVLSPYLPSSCIRTIGLFMDKDPEDENVNNLPILGNL